MWSLGKPGFTLFVCGKGAVNDGGNQVLECEKADGNISWRKRGSLIELTVELCCVDIESDFGEER